MATKKLTVKEFFQMTGSAVFAMIVLSLTFHWAFIALLVLMIPWILIWTLVGAAQAVFPVDEKKSKT